MAAWQFKIEIVHNSIVAGREGLSLDEWDEGLWWSDIQPNDELITSITSLLPQKESWADELHQWGKQDSDLIEIWYENGKVESISARIDTREPEYEFIKELIRVVADWDCRMIYTRYRNVLPNNYKDFLKVFQDSPNFKVVSNPEEWLPKMASEVANMQKNH